MWVEGGDIHDELLDRLGAVLAPPADVPLTPSAAELEALAAAVTARWPEGAGAPDAAPSVHPLRPVRRPLRRLGSSAWRAGSVAAAVVLFSASAAAAAGGVPLPRPVREVAYTVGLPVDSPALDDTNHHIKELKEAVKANDQPKAVATARRLTTDLTKVPSEEKKGAVKSVVEAMVAAAPLIQNVVPIPPETAPPSSSTTATAPPSSTTATTAAPAEKKAPAPDTTTTERPTTTTTTTTAPEPTTTTTVPASGPAPSDGSGTPSGGTGTGSGDPAAGGAGAGGGDPGSTTPTTAPGGGTTTTTTTTAPAGGGSPGGDPGSTTTTTTSSSTTTTTTTTMPPSDPGTGTNP